MKRVLVIDDDQDLRWFLYSFLSSEGLEVTTSGDGIEALRKIPNITPDVILLDLKMPKYDGIKTLETLRRERCQIPIIILTAHGELISPAEAMRLGAYDYLCKPFNNEDLLLAINRALERRKLLHQLEELQTGSLGKRELSAFISEAVEKIEKGLSLAESIGEFQSALEKEVILNILQKTKGNRSQAARMLKMDYKTLYYKLKNYQILKESNSSKRYCSKKEESH